MIMDEMVLVWFDGVHASTVTLFYLVSGRPLIGRYEKKSAFAMVSTILCQKRVPCVCIFRAVTQE